MEPSGKHLALKLEPGSSKAQLGTDCRCGNCLDGPHENVFWEDKRASQGLYEIWIQQFQICGEEKIDSEFRLDVYERNQLKATLTGKLQQGQSQALYYEFGG